jgi:hypothetical protein
MGTKIMLGLVVPLVSLWASVAQLGLVEPAMVAWSDGFISHPVEIDDDYYAEGLYAIQNKNCSRRRMTTNIQESSPRRNGWLKNSLVTGNSVKKSCRRIFAGMAAEIENLVRAIMNATLQQGNDQRVIRHPGDFSGKNEDWPGFSFKWESFCSLQGMEDELTHAGRTPSNALQIADMAGETQSRARKLYNMLVGTVKGKALRIVRTAERNNGYQAWRLLKEEYEPSIGGRHTGILMGLLDPCRGKPWIRMMHLPLPQCPRRLTTRIQDALASPRKIRTLAQSPARRPCVVIQS